MVIYLWYGWCWVLTKFDRVVRVKLNYLPNVYLACIYSASTTFVLWIVVVYSSPYAAGLRDENCNGVPLGEHLHHPTPNFNKPRVIIWQLRNDIQVINSIIKLKWWSSSNLQIFLNVFIYFGAPIKLRVLWYNWNYKLLCYINHLMQIAKNQKETVGWFIICYLAVPLRKRELRMPRWNQHLSSTR